MVSLSQSFPQAESLAAIRFARFFSFRFRTRPRTFDGASERFAKPRMEIITRFSSLLGRHHASLQRRFVDYGQTVAARNRSLAPEGAKACAKPKEKNWANRIAARFFHFSTAGSVFLSFFFSPEEIEFLHIWLLSSLSVVYKLPSKIRTAPPCWKN